MKIAFLHTAQVHVATFNTLVNALSQDVECEHHVAPDLLERAQADGLAAVAYETTVLLAKLAQADAVLCSCSTLGPLADAVAKTHPNVIRVDRPLMEAAAKAGPNVMVAICLQSTRDATLELLQSCASQIGETITPRLVLCDLAWPFFEQGATAGFATKIADTINAVIAQHGKPDCIVLAQASMRVATSELSGLDIPVLSSPSLATRRLLDVATASFNRSNT